MTIKILKGCSGLNFSYAQHDTVEVGAELGKNLISCGYAEEVEITADKSAGKKKTGKDNPETGGDNNAKVENAAETV